MDQDPALDNLVQPADYAAVPLGSLGRVDKWGSGPRSMVLIAGAGFGGGIFRGFMEARAHEYTMYAVSLAGFGRTQADPRRGPRTAGARGPLDGGHAGSAAAGAREPGFDAEHYVEPGQDYMRAYARDSWNGAAAASPMIEVHTIANSRLFIMDDQPEQLDALEREFLSRLH